MTSSLNVGLGQRLTCPSRVYAVDPAVFIDK